MKSRSQHPAADRSEISHRRPKTVACYSDFAINIETILGGGLLDTSMTILGEDGRREVHHRPGAGQGAEGEVDGPTPRQNAAPWHQSLSTRFFSTHSAIPTTKDQRSPLFPSETNGSPGCVLQIATVGGR